MKLNTKIHKTDSFRFWLNLICLQNFWCNNFQISFYYTCVQCLSTIETKKKTETKTQFSMDVISFSIFISVTLTNNNIQWIEHMVVIVVGLILVDLPDNNDFRWIEKKNSELIGRKEWNILFQRFHSFIFIHFVI